MKHPLLKFPLPPFSSVICWFDSTGWHSGNRHDDNAASRSFSFLCFFFFFIFIFRIFIFYLSYLMRQFSFFLKKERKKKKERPALLLCHFYLFNSFKNEISWLFGRLFFGGRLLILSCRNASRWSILYILIFKSRRTGENQTTRPRLPSECYSEGTKRVKKGGW